MRSNKVMCVKQKTVIIMFSKEKVEEICGQHYYFKSDLSNSVSLVTGKKIGNAALSVAIKAVKAIKAKDSGKI